MPGFAEEHDASFQCSPGVEQSAGLLVHPAAEDVAEGLGNQPYDGQAEVFIKLKIQKNYLLWDCSWEKSVNHLKKPLSNFTVVRASKESMGEVASVLRLAKSAGWTVNVSQQPV